MSLLPVMSSAEAQEVVEKIAKEYGWISRIARNRSHQEALDAIKCLQIGLGASAQAYDLTPSLQDTFY
jgi:hypothetical protein